mmetsp:Transcript_74477/g.215946  ORF Transcript_74477/g.215946 Transcript_74477/m.215946 type:complete len:215 (-) Transcript_74477:274-918(-)
MRGCLGKFVVCLHGFDLRLVNFDLLLAEVVQQLLQRLDDAIGVEVVVLHLHLVGGLLQQSHGLPRRLGPREAKRLSEAHGREEGVRHARELREARGGLRGLQRLQRARQRIQRRLQISRVGVVLCLRRRTLRIRLGLLLLVLSDGILGSLDVLVVRVALGRQLLNRRGEGGLVVLALLNGLHPLLRRVLAEACEFLVGFSLGLALGQDLRLKGL